MSDRVGEGGKEGGDVAGQKRVVERKKGEERGDCKGGLYQQTFSANDK